MEGTDPHLCGLRPTAMKIRLTSILAVLALVAGVVGSLSARNLESANAGCSRPEKTAERPAEESADVREEAPPAPPAREESKPAKPTRQRPAWPPPSELIA